MDAFLKFILCCLTPSDWASTLEEQSLPNILSIAAGRCREICPDFLCICNINNGFFFAVCANLSLAASVFYVVGTFARIV